MTINVVVLTGFGINADEETQRAFNRVGAQASRIHLNDLLADPSLLDRAHILAIPGGFSFGDAAGPGKILANRLRFKLEKALQDFVGRGKLAIGISNGFQVMLRLGMLPFFDGSFQQTCTLSQNDSARFENRWVHLRRPENTRCLWLHEVESLDLPLRCEHGKFIPQDESVLKRLFDQGQVALQYASSGDEDGAGVASGNPIGSTEAIAGICDPSGRLFGLMPRPEAYQDRVNHPEWTGLHLPEEGAGLQIFRNAVEFARREL